MKKIIYLSLIVIVSLVILALIYHYFFKYHFSVTRNGTHPAELVVVHANIFTAGSTQSEAEAIAVTDGRFVYVGENSGIGDFIGPKTKVINAKGNMMVPGLIDNHCHVMWMSAMQGIMLNAYHVSTLDELTSEIRQYAETYPNDPFVIAIGWNYDHVHGNIPDTALADQILEERPLFLWSYDGHSGWVNSKALNIMQERNPEAFEELTPERDQKTGEPTGILLHFYAFNPFDYFPLETLDTNITDRLLNAQEEVLREALSYGITTLNDVQIYRSFMPMIELFKERDISKEIRLRGSYYISHYAKDRDDETLNEELEEWITTGKELSDENLFLGNSVKLYVDGVFASHTAFMLDPYSNRTDYYGEALWTQNDLNRAVAVADRLGLQACIHGIGDAGIRRIVNAVEYARNMNGKRDSRHRIEHCQLPIPDDQKRMADLGIYAAMQPCHFYSDSATAAALGDDRIEWHMPWKSLEQAGVTLSFGSDWVAGPLNPVYGLVIAGTRYNYTGTNDWGPEEKITLDDALRHYTIDCAKTLMLEDRIGSIEVGKYADFAIYDIDLTKVARWWFLLTHETDIGTLDDFVEMTSVGGTIVYEKGM
ncbi:amidohydrolase [Bacteroidota bacterium]